MIDEKDEWLRSHGIPVYAVDLGSENAPKQLDMIIESETIDAIVHFGAESHVDNSIKNPGIFVRSNVIGTFNVVEAARRHSIRIHVVSTDEVYGETTPSDWFDSTGLILPERKQIIPSSPYSSSKASADLLALSYCRTFGLKVTVSRCSNNAGPWQMTEKLLPTVIGKAMRDEPIPVYGAGNQKRHWIHVDDHNRSIMKILEDGVPGKIYNIGPVRENWISNLEMIRFILSYMKKPESLISYVTDRPGHDTSYFIPESDFGFKTRPYTEFMPEIIDWYTNLK